MAENWAADVKKLVPDANDKAIAGIVKYCDRPPKTRFLVGLLHGTGGGCAGTQ